MFELDIKKYIPPDHRGFCLGSEKLEQIYSSICSDLKPGEPLLIPFGGPGSIAIYFESKGIPTIAGDINYSTLYKNPQTIINQYIHETSRAATVSHDFIQWNATNLPIASNSCSAALVNPPFGIKCDLCIGDPIELARKSLGEIIRVIKPGGNIYLVYPEVWNKLSIEDNFNTIVTVIDKHVLSTHLPTRLPITLTKLKKLYNPC